MDLDLDWEIAMYSQYTAMCCITNLILGKLYKYKEHFVLLQWSERVELNTKCYVAVKGLNPTQNKPVCHNLLHANDELIKHWKQDIH